jgi:hypothetical protein
MKMQLEGREVKFDALELFGSLPKEDKLEFVKMAMMWDDEIFAEIVESLVVSEYASPTFNDHIFKARQRMLELLPECLRDVAKRLMRDAESSRLQMEQHRSYAWSLSHRWPWECPSCQYRMPAKPKEPEFISAAMPTEQQITAAIEAQV